MVPEAGNWRWSSYRAMIGKAARVPWLTVDWLLGQFGNNRRQAVENYAAFVNGRERGSIWSQLKRQIYLGDDRFIARIQRHRITAGDLSEVPRIQRRGPVKPLADYAAQAAHPKQAMAEAWRAGEYSMKEIARFFDVLYSTVSRAARQWQLDRQ